MAIRKFVVGDTKVTQGYRSPRGSTRDIRLPILSFNSNRGSIATFP